MTMSRISRGEFAEGNIFRGHRGRVRARSGRDGGERLIGDYWVRVYTNVCETRLMV